MSISRRGSCHHVGSELVRWNGRPAVHPKTLTVSVSCRQSPQPLCTAADPVPAKRLLFWSSDDDVLPSASQAAFPSLPDPLCNPVRNKSGWPVKKRFLHLSLFPLPLHRLSQYPAQPSLQGFASSTWPGPAKKKDFPRTKPPARAPEPLRWPLLLPLPSQHTCEYAARRTSDPGGPGVLSANTELRYPH